MLFNSGCGYLGRVIPLICNLSRIVQHSTLSIYLSIYKYQDYQEQLLSNPVVRKPVRLVRSGEAFDLQPVGDYQRSSIYSNDLIEFPVGTSGT